MRSVVVQLSRLGGSGAVAAAAGVTAALAVAGPGLAAGRPRALENAAHATVTNAAGVTLREGIVVDAAGRAVYALSGDGRRHPECTRANHCTEFWPPVTTRSRHPLAGPGVRGRLGVWRRSGFTQLTLNGRPLYTYSGDSRRDAATGEGIVSFGGTWGVIRTSRPHATPGGGSGTPTTPTYTTPNGTTTTPTGTYTTPTVTTTPTYPW